MAFLNGLRMRVRAAIVSNLEKFMISGNQSYLFGSGVTSSGIILDEKSAAAVGMNATCIRVAAEDLGSLPLHVYRRDPKDRDRREVATDHPLYPVMHQSPNPLQTKMEFFEMMAADLRGWGNAYAYLDLGSRMDVVAMWRMDPARITIARPGGYRSATAAYTYRDESGKEEVLDPSRILHIRGQGDDPIKGKSVVSHFAETLGMSIAIQRYGSTFFRNNARGDFYLKHPQKLSGEAVNRLRSQLEARHASPDNWHRPMVLEEGADVMALRIPLQDVMLIDAMKLTERQICGWHRMPLHKVGILDHATFSNIEQQEIGYATAVIRPDAVRIEQAIMRCCFGPKEAREYFVEHSLEGLLRGDLKARFEAYAVGLNSGFMTAATVTKRENLPPVQGADIRMLPANMLLMDSTGKIINEPKSEPMPTPAKGAAQ